MLKKIFTFGRLNNTKIIEIFEISHQVKISVNLHSQFTFDSNRVLEIETNNQKLNHNGDQQ